MSVESRNPEDRGFKKIIKIFLYDLAPVYGPLLIEGKPGKREPSMFDRFLDCNVPVPCSLIDQTPPHNILKERGGDLNE